MKEKFSRRLQQAMNSNFIKPTELSNKTGIGKGVISSYLSGKYKPSDKNLELLSNALDVSEAWLRGYDIEISKDKVVSISNDINENEVDLKELKALIKKGLPHISQSEADVIKFIMKKTIKEYENSKK